MNLSDPKYANFALVEEMLRTPDLVGDFDFDQTKSMASAIQTQKKLFFTGEGSSRIFPAKSFISSALQAGLNLQVATDGSLQAMDYDLKDWAVLAASNSGQTKEIVMLFKNLAESGHSKRYGVTANALTLITELSNESIVLSCGKEKAVAATISVVEQALVYRSILCHLLNCDCPAKKKQAAELMSQTLAAEYPNDLIQKMAAAPVIYLAGRNNGVAEELALKTNEITRKRSQFLEGTIVVHGIEEVMNPEDVAILIDPFESEYDKMKKSLIDGVGMTVIAISKTQTPFPTIRIPTLFGYDLFLQLMAGWNLLVQCGVACGVDLDKPKRARKIGNEFTK